MIDRFEKNCIVIYYPATTGGKFLANCLGLSRHCVLNNIDWATWDLAQSDTHQYRQAKLRRVQLTVPHSADDIYWSNNEIDEHRGLLLPQIRSDQVSAEVQAVIESDRRYCLICHSREHLLELLKEFPGITVIKFTNFIRWMRISAFKNIDTYNSIDRKVNYHYWVDKNELVEPDAAYILFDVDTNFLDIHQLEQSLQDLYLKLGFDDFDRTPWRDYYLTWFNAHTLKEIE